jgi:hypothetical protein
MEIPVTRAQKNWADKSSALGYEYNNIFAETFVWRDSSKWICRLRFHERFWGKVAKWHLASTGGIRYLEEKTWHALENAIRTKARGVCDYREIAEYEEAAYSVKEV